MCRNNQVCEPGTDDNARKRRRHSKRIIKRLCVRTQIRKYVTRTGTRRTRWYCVRLAQCPIAVATGSLRETSLCGARVAIDPYAAKTVHATRSRTTALVWAGSKDANRVSPRSGIIRLPKTNATGTHRGRGYTCE